MPVTLQPPATIRIATLTIIPGYYSTALLDPVRSGQMLPRTSRSSLVAIVDDDISVRESVKGLLRSVGYQVNAYASAEEFMGSPHLKAANCLILDVKLDGMSGPDLQRELKAAGKSVPIIFVTAHASETLRVRMLADGAIDCLSKPFNHDTLLNVVEIALRSRG
jgi:FixJ family two-component response regulator